MFKSKKKRSLTFDFLALSMLINAFCLMRYLGLIVRDWIGPRVLESSCTGARSCFSTSCMSPIQFRHSHDAPTQPNGWIVPRYMGPCIIMLGYEVVLLSKDLMISSLYLAVVKLPCSTTRLDLPTCEIPPYILTYPMVHYWTKSNDVVNERETMCAVPWDMSWLS